MTMNYYLFLLSIFSVVCLSKAGPLRLQKRAAFYIANETACVVDNIVYSSGDPIPTDDPCEACKCRPPGFACVLKECKVKPGCRAVRHVGHCCPEYVCDNPEITPVIGDNALPPANLLPDLYESVLPGAFPGVEVAETTKQSEASTSTPEPLKSTDIPIVKETTLDPEIEEKSSKVEINIKEIPEEKEEPKEDNIENKDEEPQVLFNSETEIKKEDEIKVTTVKEVIEVTTVKEEIEDKSTESTVSKPEISTESAPEVKEEDPFIAIKNDEVVESEAEETTERHVEIAVTSTIAATTESPVKNSAAQNSKSLKLLEDQTSEELVEKIELIKAALPRNTAEETDAVTSVSAEEVPNKVATNDANVPTKIEPEVEENIAEESSNEHPSIAFYSNDDKVVKKESAETVTIVVHVREKSKPPTETDFETEEKATEVYLTSEQPERISLKSNDNIKTEISTESTTVEEATSTGKNFEVFPSSTEISNVELYTSSPKDQEENIEERSEPDSADVDTEEKPTNDETSDSKSNADSLVTETTPVVNEEVSKISKKGREGEIIEELKDNEEKVPEEEPKVTEDPKTTEASKEQKITEKPQNELKVTVEQPNIALKIKIITDSDEGSPKIKEIEVKSDKKVTEEAKPGIEDPKPEENVESKSEESVEEAKEEEKVEEPKLDKLEEVKTDETTETKPEERSIEDEQEEKVEESKPEDKVEESKIEEGEESKQEEKIGESTSEEIIENAKHEEKIEEVKQEEKADDTNVESKNSEEKQEDQNSEEVKDQESVESNKSEEPKDSE